MGRHQDRTAAPELNDRGGHLLLVLAAVLAVGALVFGLVSGAGLDLTLQRTARARSCSGSPPRG